MTKDDLEEELRAANANRAILYYLIFDELRNARGEAEASKIMRAAIHRRGQELAASIKQFAPDRVKALGEYHVAHSAGGGKIFNPEVKRLDETGFEVLNTTCPPQGGVAGLWAPRCGGRQDVRDRFGDRLRQVRRCRLPLRLRYLEARQAWLLHAEGLSWAVTALAPEPSYR